MPSTTFVEKLLGDISVSTGYTATYGTAPVKRLSATVSNDAGAAITLQLGTAAGVWRLRGLNTLHSAGTGVTTQVALGDLSTFTPTDVNTKYYDGAATAKGTVYPRSWNSGIYFYTDTNGRAYLRSGVNAGADNTFFYEIYAEPVRSI